MKSILVAIALLLTIEVIARNWHQPHPDGGARSEVVLNLPEKFPDNGGGTFARKPISPEQVLGLSHDRGRRYHWKSKSEHGHDQSADLIYLEYDSGSSRCFADLFNHSPEVCMAAAGELIKAERRPETIQGTTVGVRTAVFREYRSRMPLYVYKATWFSQSYPVELGVNDHVKKAQTALIRQPAPPARMIACVLRGFNRDTEARAFFNSQILESLTLGDSSD